MKENKKWKIKKTNKNNSFIHKIALILPYNIKNHGYGCNDCSNNDLESDKNHYDCFDYNFAIYIDRKELFYIVENRNDYE